MDIQKMFNLKGKRALVTGSSRGIGKAIAMTLACAGADMVFHASKKSERLDSSAEQARQYGIETLALPANLADINECDSLIENIHNHFDCIDILVLNASVQYKRPWKEFNAQEFQAQIDVNIKSSLRLIQMLAPEMISKNWGRILTIGSINQNAQHPEMATYAATKSAVLNITQNFARQFAVHGITVNNLAPGVIMTDRNSECLSDPDYSKQVLDKIPAKRFGEVYDCCGAALLLCSDASGYITGQNIFVAGGMGL